MKIRKSYWVVLLVLLLLAIPGSALAQDIDDGQVVFGGSYTLREGDTLDGDLVVIGGFAELEKGSVVNGNIALIGGNLQASGDVNGDVVALGGLIELLDGARVRGDVMSIGANIDRAENARIDGEVNSAATAPLAMRFPSGVKMPHINLDFSPVISMIWFMFRVFIWAALAVLAAMFLPTHTHRISQAAIKQPFITGGLGLLTAMVGPFILIGLIITIILFPIALLAVLLGIVAWAWGIIALGAEVGKRTAMLLSQNWPLPVTAGIGTFLLTLVMNGVSTAMPCIGWILPAVIICVGFGAVMVTRFGFYDYPEYGTGVPASVPVVEPLKEQQEFNAGEQAATDE